MLKKMFEKKSQGVCPFCGKKINFEVYKDDISKKEFELMIKVQKDMKRFQVIEEMKLQF